MKAFNAEFLILAGGSSFGHMGSTGEGITQEIEDRVRRIEIARRMFGVPLHVEEEGLIRPGWIPDAEKKVFYIDVQWQYPFLDILQFTALTHAGGGFDKKKMAMLKGVGSLSLKTHEAYKSGPRTQISFALRRDALVFQVE